MISMIDASPFDAATAYVAIDRHQMDDIRPHIYRTHDFGKTWTSISSGIAGNAYVHVVRTDTQRKGLLFAGTEVGAYVSFDDGDHWQTLQLNLPVTPIRDLVVKNNDLVVATHGRSFWILDDISPLRQVTAALATKDAHLFKPGIAIRIRKNQGRDTPLPRETPAGQNPPAGAIIDYYLKTTPSGLVTLEILDSKGTLVRKYSSNDSVAKLDESQAFPTYWLPPPTILPTRAGMNRFIWDLRYQTPKALRYGYSIAAVPGDAIREPEGPLVLPGMYQVRLTVAGRAFTTLLEVSMDPRIQVPATELNQQLALAMKVAEAMSQSYEAAHQIRDVRRQIKELQTRLASDPNRKAIVDALMALDEKAVVIGGSGQPQFPPPTEPTLASLNGALAELITNVGSADTAPTEQAADAFETYRLLVGRQLASWAELKSKDLATVNSMLRKANLAEIK
jgi:hypothetical protein